jgi:hypothetical protein
MEAQKWLTVLEEKIEKWGVPREAETEQMERMISTLERLEELLTQIESSLKLKLALNEKMENTIARINRLTWPGEELPTPKKTPDSGAGGYFGENHQPGQTGLAGSGRPGFRGANVFRICPKDAGKRQERGDGEQQDKPADNRSSREQPDLQSILQPLGTLVQNVVEEKLKKMTGGGKARRRVARENRRKGLLRRAAKPGQVANLLSLFCDFR